MNVLVEQCYLIRAVEIQKGNHRINVYVEKWNVCISYLKFGAKTYQENKI